jgi:thiol-disulfide isomerase/thioredoxin
MILIRFLFFLLVILVNPGCRENLFDELSRLELTGINDSERQFIRAGTDSVLVLVFLAPDCPLCINYTYTLKNLNKEYAQQAVRFRAVFPGKFFSTEEIREFVSKYEISLPAIYDHDHSVVKVCEASVTPQAVVFDRQDRKIYSGAIDNFAFQPGGKRTVVTKHYLKDAIDHALQGKMPPVRNTEAVGCFIE